MRRDNGELVAFWLEVNENDNRYNAPHGFYDQKHEIEKARLFLDAAKHGVRVVHGIHIGCDSMYPVVEDPVKRREAVAWAQGDGTSKGQTLSELAVAWAAGDETRLGGRWNRGNAELLKTLVDEQIRELLPRDEGWMAFIAYDREVANHDVHWPTTWGMGRQMRVKTRDVVCFDAACWADTQTATRTVKLDQGSFTNYAVATQTILTYALLLALLLLALLNPHNRRGFVV